MSTVKRLFALFLVVAVVTATVSCSKNEMKENSHAGPSAPYTLKYSDSILYLKTQSQDYIVSPLERRTGTYTGYPEGIELDEKTGAINVTKSETGLRYRITYTSPAGDTSSTYVVISGINFSDHFYRLSTGDSIAPPLYNASATRVLPLNGSSFDEGNTANSGGCSIKTDNGRINLAQSLRSGIFGSNPKNDERKDFDISYRVNDNSGKSLNKIKVRIYFYKNMSDVSPDLLQTLNERQQGGVFIGGKGTGDQSTNITAGLLRPRPACVIIIAN